MEAQCGRVSRGDQTLDILKEVQRAYEQRMDRIEQQGGRNKLELQVEVLRAWVSDLVSQNSLLVRVVEDLELEATSRLALERRKHTEMSLERRAEAAALRRRLARKDADLRGLLEVLRRLREFDYCTLDGIHFFEVTESDIFGPSDWREQKLESGDSGARRARPESHTQDEGCLKLM
ncbi:hypothetical protein JYU34_002980 [Plutella xylostella]|uniref:Uncharacterized protein n=1 Tax=Plutella xylostella TaxID=51655 RepID=A0ABQ7R3N8_PLUXY|nr:hypothetical protein JYU34_002980 [Plutella xylostella]